MCILNLDGTRIAAGDGPQGAIDAGSGRLIKADLRNKILRGLRFVDVDLGGGSFSGSDLRGCNFEGASLRRVSFVGADLRWVYWGRGRKMADARDAYWGECKWPNVWGQA